MAVFGRRKHGFPILRKMLESSEKADMVEDCMITYAELLDEGVARSSLPLPIRHVREASLLVHCVVNGGNGFENYHLRQGWDAERVAVGLDGLDALGLGEIARRLRPFTDRISAAAENPARRTAAIRDAWQVFPKDDFRYVEDAWVGSRFAHRARPYLLDNVTFVVVAEAEFQTARSAYRAGL